MILGSVSIFLVLINLSIASGLVSDSFDAGFEKQNVAVGKSLSMWCGLRRGVPFGMQDAKCRWHSPEGQTYRVIDGNGEI